MLRREFLITGAVAAGALAGGLKLAAAQPASEAARFHAARRYLETGFGRIAYVEQGEGPAALFLHGWPLNGFQWRGAMARLSDARRCVAADFMGLGYTDVAADMDLSPINQCEMIVAVMDALNIDRADLVSNDSATTIAQLLAARHPERVRSMLITNGDVHTNSPPEPLKPTIEEARQGLLVERLERQVIDPRIAQTEEGLGVVYTDPTILTPEVVDVYLRPLVSTPKRRLQCQQYGVAFEPNPLPAIEQALRRSQIPARILWGTADFLFAAEWAEWLDAALPRSQGVRYLEGAKLFFPEEFPKIIAEEARRLWLVA
ncbi:MAG: alpha/beta hydrolase [Pseudomonadota bacterium]|nr:alpha/beta hydrolase [Pseudomonadota bacterium]